MRFLAVSGMRAALPTRVTVDPASAVFEAAGSPGGGYAWKAVARHVVEHAAPEVKGRLRFDPEGSMFCAYAR
jgi:hypothetical protein